MRIPSKQQGSTEVHSGMYNSMRLPWWLMALDQVANGIGGVMFYLCCYLEKLNDSGYVS